MNESFEKTGSTLNLKYWEINVIDTRDDFTQANSILFLARITKKLFTYHEYLKTEFLTCLLALLVD